MEDFPYKTQPYKHQADCFTISRDREAYGLFLEMGTGKSKIIIDTAAHQSLTKQSNATIIVAPKGVYRNWTDDEGEIATHMSDAVPYRMGYWSSSANKKSREMMARLNEPGNFHRFLAINIEATASTRATDEINEFLKRYPTAMLAIDESTTIKNPKARRTKVMSTLGKYAKFRRIATGNPIPNGVVDLHSQTEFLKPNLMGFGNYYAFRHRFAIMQDLDLGPGRVIKKVVGYKDMAYLSELMRKFSFVIKKKDCLDLPEKVYQYRDVEMGTDQRRMYNEMLEECYTQINGQDVTAQIVLTQMLRLHQIVCGFVKTSSGEELDIIDGNERLDTLIELLEQAPGKVIVWANYRRNIVQILRKIKEHPDFGPSSVVDYWGDTTDEKRQEAKLKFQDPNSGVRFIVANPSTGKWGNTWTQATTVIYYSNSHDLEPREQSEDRAHRIGQAGHVFNPGESPSVLYIDLRTRGTIDDRIIKVLRQKKKLTDEVMTSNWKWLIGEMAEAA